MCILNFVPSTRRTLGMSQGSDASVPLTTAQKKEVEEAFGLFDYAKTGVLDLHEVKVRGKCHFEIGTSSIQLPAWGVKNVRCHAFSSASRCILSKYRDAIT